MNTLQRSKMTLEDAENLRCFRQLGLITLGYVKSFFDVHSLAVPQRQISFSHKFHKMA